MLTKINEHDELKIYKSYKLNYEHWIMNLKDSSVVKNITENFQKTTIADKIFTEKELEWLYGYAFSRCGKVRHNNNGTMFISLNLQGVYEKFKYKIDKLLPGAEHSPVVGGNFFITPSQYGLHNDSTRHEDWQQTLQKTSIDDINRKYVPWRNIIIPMWTCPDNVESHGVFFKQRHVDYAHVYNHGMHPGKETATTYPIVTDHSTIDFYILDGSKQPAVENTRLYDKDHYEKYLYYTNYNRLSGLEPETTVDWKPGCPIVFDAFQLHATNKGFENKQWNNKMGLLLTFLREIK